MIKCYLNQFKVEFNLISIVDVNQGISVSNSSMKYLDRIRETLKSNSLSFNMTYPFRDLSFRNY